MMKSMIVLTGIALTCSISCNEAKTNGADGPGSGGEGGGDGDGDGDETCQELSEVQCDARAECESILGWTVDNEESRFAGCRLAGAGLDYVACNTAQSCGVSPTTGTCWGFGNDCGPDGWEIIDGGATQGVPEDCPSHCQPDP